MPLDITPAPLLPSSSPLAPPVLRRDLFLKVASARLLFDVCVTCGGWLMKLLGRTCARALATAPAAYGARLTARQTLRTCIFRAAPALSFLPRSASRPACCPRVGSTSPVVSLSPFITAPLRRLRVALILLFMCHDFGSKNEQDEEGALSPSTGGVSSFKCTIGSLFVFSHLSASCAFLCAAQWPVALLLTQPSSHPFSQPFTTLTSTATPQSHN